MADRPIPRGSSIKAPLDREDKAYFAMLRRTNAMEARDDKRVAQEKLRDDKLRDDKRVAH